MSVKPKKSLGQHFLKDQRIAAQIADQLLGDADFVVEIGPGMGVLTQFLLERFGTKLHVVEIDTESVAYLENHYPELRSRIHSADFLKMNLSEVFPGSIAVVGNYPYNISSQILFHLLDYRQQVVEIAGMFQREVARRITMAPGSKEYGILSVLLELYYERKYAFTVSEQVFNPPPKVKSGVVQLRAKIEAPSIDFGAFKQMVKMAFNQRRKTLRNSLRSYHCSGTESIWQKRPEQLGLDEFLHLFEIIEGRASDAQ